MLINRPNWYEGMAISYISYKRFLIEQKPLNFRMCVCRTYIIRTQGPSIKYVTLFLANFDPLPLSHFVTHPRTPLKYVTHLGHPPQFLVGLVQSSRTKVPCTNSISIVREGFCPGFCPGWFLSVPLVSQYICYSRKLNITLNFMFHMYDRNCISVTSHALYPLHLSQTVTHSRTSSPLEGDVLYGRPLFIIIGLKFTTSMKYDELETFMVYYY